MKLWGKRTVIYWVAAVLVAALAAAGWPLAKAAPIMTGFAAKTICSYVFISGRDAADVFREDVAPVIFLATSVSYRVDREARAVTADTFGFAEARAVFREGCGCTLVRGVPEAELNTQPIAAGEIRESAIDDLPWLAAGREIAEPLPPGVDAGRLKQALDAAFTEERPAMPKRTRAVLVVYDGRLIAERYAPGFTPGMPLLGWSISKSVTNALVGILVQKGRLRLDQPAPVREWQAEGDSRRTITLDQLMRMSSGLEFDEVYTPFGDTAAMLCESGDFAAYAAAKPLAAAPGSQWSYSSGTANIISRIVRQAMETETPNSYRFLRRELFDAIGMTSAVMEADPSGTFVGSSYTFATPRDWARFGLLFLQDGVWNGKRILPEGWVTYTTTPAAKAPKGEYGAMFWLNAGATSDPASRRWPSVPADAYSAEGFQKQQVIVIPSRKLVLVRFGATPAPQAWNTEAFIADVLSVLPP
jgi:CubicO group peptidase (beta-lactamase class C family)